MKKFKQLRVELEEGAYKAKAGEKVVKTFKVGKKKKYEAVITKKGNYHCVYVDGDKLDEFKSIKDAEKAAKEFTDLMGG
tara:strand:+ start:6057 stop:6293 length:237 start_codon:yes stop_codon:yes gene_type:complete